MMDTNVSTQDHLADAVRELVISYHELNSAEIDELYEEPSPLEFMRYVARNRPFVIRGGARDWAACKKWNARYLSEAMSGQGVNVAITPHGNADAPLTTPTGPIFIKPHEIILPFPHALSLIRTQELSPSPPSQSSHTHYLQTQNNNLPSEYTPLLPDIPSSIPFARIALTTAPDALNFWLGNSHSTTALHKDNYENIYVQVLGRKKFVLLPPSEAACVGERVLKGATYVRAKAAESGNEHSSEAEHREGEDEEFNLIPELDEPLNDVPTAVWDPDRPLENTTPFSHLARPMRVVLGPGDMLYLPALWYHKVSQECSDEGICCAVNYWYDMEFTGGFWSMCGLVRGVGNLAATSSKG